MAVHRQQGEGVHQGVAVVGRQYDGTVLWDIPESGVAYLFEGAVDVGIDDGPQGRVEYIVLINLFHQAIIIQFS